jgi:hypothetical protein
MKTPFLILILLFILISPAQAQFRYSTYTLPSTTNTVIASNAMTTFNSSCDVANSSRAYIRLAFKLTSQTTNAMSATCSNNVTATFDLSGDGTYFTNQFQLAVQARTNNTVWGYTNIDVSQWAWVRLVSITNANHAKVTNHSVFIGAKQGL